MLKKINIDKKIETLIKVLCTISAGFLTFMISLRYEHNYTLAGVINSWLLVGVIMYYKVSIKKIDMKKLLFSIIPGLLVLNIAATRINADNLISYYPKYFHVRSFLMADLFRVMSFPLVLFITYVFIDKIVPKIIEFIKSLDKVEKTFLIVSGIVGVVGTFILADKTTAFTFPVYQGKFIKYDVIYTLDCTVDVFQNISSFANDIRNPLFGIMAIPFAVVGLFIANLIPFGRNGYSFITLMSSIQVVVVALTLVLLGRLLKLDKKNKVLFYIFCFSTLPFILFSITIEQYVISVFYLILFIYVYYETKTKKNFVYVASTGSILTSGLLFPLISKAKSFKKWLTDVFDCFLAFVTVTIVGGQLPQVFEAVNDVTTLLGSFSGKITEEVKLNRFTHFIKELFFAAPGQVKIPKTFPSYISLDPINISIIGIAILLICIVSVFLNRKNNMAIISGIWVLFSIILLYVVGWGAPENGYILYSYYFGWAYLILYFLFFKKIFEKKPKLFTGTIIATIVIMLITNIPVMYKIIEFGIMYYR